jgi:dTDP-glucose 4,6-dehydratase
MKSCLVTGGSGFIGSNLIAHILASRPDCQVINLDKLTHAAMPGNLDEVSDDPGYHFVKGDICDRRLVGHLFDTFNIQSVYHLAAESHVDDSISSPEVFIKTNIEGTFTLLDVARVTWMEEPGRYRPGYEDCRFLYVSTDEVYGSLEAEGAFNETTPFAPNSPYSASKAAGDMLVRSYYSTYGMDVVITNCSNNYGPRQHIDKLIPLVIARALSGEPIPVYGDGRNVRDWLYVHDHCRAIELVFDKGRSGESYNVGGRNERENIWIVETICDYLQEIKPLESDKMSSYKDLITFVKDRPGHDRRYAVDATKLEQELGWCAGESLEGGLRSTVEWYVQRWDDSNYSALG